MAEIGSKNAGSYKMKCLIVDDESIAIKGIVNYIDKLDFLEVADYCSSALEAADILKKVVFGVNFKNLFPLYLGILLNFPNTDSSLGPIF